MMDSQIQCDTGGASAVNKQYPEYPTQEMHDNQLKFLRKEFQDTDGYDHTLLVGHYEIFSSHSHYKCMDEIDQMAKEANIQAYIFGHKHEMAFLTSTADAQPDTPAENRLNYLCSGMAALQSPPRPNN